jgi:DNA-binding MarR family transcriptional regulator
MGFNFQKLFSRYATKSPERWKIYGWSCLTNSLLFDERLTKNHLLVCLVIAVHHFRGQDYCNPSLRTIAREARLSIQTTINAVRELEKQGWLQVERNPGKANKYYPRFLR